MSEEASIRLTGIIGVAITAFCVWLAVRIVNRRERWAKWAAVATVTMLLAYPLSIGPIHWTCHRLSAPDWIWNAVYQVYEPLFVVAFYGPEPVSRWLAQYSFIGSPSVECGIEVY
jgi:hypothetical protein